MGFSMTTATDAVMKDARSQGGGIVPLFCDADNDGFDSSEDCNNLNGSIHPNATEDCNNGVDDNCDGLVDTNDPNCVDSPNPNAIIYAPGCSDNILDRNDDESTEAVALPFPINFAGTVYNAVFVNNNGNVTFDAPLSDFTPFPLVGTDRVIIAPFFGDVDTRNVESDVVRYGNAMFEGRSAFCVLWAGVGVGYYDQNVDKLNSFQLLLVDRSDTGPGNFDIVFNYDQIEWETGDASGGRGGLGGFSARVGYSNGNAITPLSFELPGSAINGAFLDSNPAGLIHDSRNSLQLGRYIFPVRNGEAPEGGEIHGKVTDPASNPVRGAIVQVCPKDGSACAWQGTTNALGNYAATGLPDGNYDVKAFPPAGSSLIPAQLDPLIENGSIVTGADIQFGAPVPPPPGTGIVPSTEGGGGVPVIYWNDQTTLTTTGCPGGTATYEIVLNGSVVDSGPMTETPPGSGHYTATVPPLFPHSGPAEVHIHIVCPDGSTEDVDFPIYIDPSGVVRTVGGAPIQGATVTLFRSDTGAPGSFVQVPNGSAIMSPANRSNPDLTNASGQFGWDVIAGFYIVRAEKDGCVSPTDPTVAFVESPVLLIPPAVIDLDLRLDCAGELTALSPAKVWVGLRNSDDVGTFFDLLAEVFINTTKVGEGQLNGLHGGSSGFNNARLHTIPLTLFAPVEVPAGAALKLKLSVRVAANSRHRSGTARLWYNGQLLGSGKRGEKRGAGTHFDATIDGITADYFLRENFALSTTPGSSMKFSDVKVDRARNGNPFKPFGTWSMTLP